MEILIKENRNKIVIFFLFVMILLTSCNALKLNKKNFRIGFSSLYENELCTLFINDSLYMDRVPILTDSSLGIDLNNGLSVKGEKLDLKIEFYALINKELDFERTIELDTILYLKNGYNLMIIAGSERIKIYQQSKPFILE